MPLGKPGVFDLFVMFHASKNRASKAKFVIQAADGLNDVFVDQSLNNRQWIKLGTFNLDKKNRSIILDASGSTDGKLVIADAVGYTLKSTDKEGED